jgi:hypothetical protein
VPDQTRDFFELLGVSREASLEELKTALRKRRAEWHPDRGGDEKLFKLAGVAFDTLADPVERQRYEDALDRAAALKGKKRDGANAQSGTQPRPPADRQSGLHEPPPQIPPAFGRRQMGIVIAAVALAAIWIGATVFLPALNAAGRPPLHPASFRPCHHVSPPPGPATLAVHCHPEGVNILVVVGNERIGQEFVTGVPIFRPCLIAMPALHAYYIGDERIGSLMCRYNANHHVLLAWTDERIDSYTKATFAEGYDARSAYRWWKSRAFGPGDPPAPAPTS